MRVAALRDLLAAMPDDLIVTVNGKHLDYLYRHFPYVAPGIRSEPHDCECGHRHTQMIGVPNVEWPAALELGSSRRSGSRAEPEPAPVFSGRWTKAMREAIDKHSLDPDA